MSHGGKRQHVRVHRAVALAHMPNTENKPVIDHIDGNRQNNHISNLRWATYKENSINTPTYRELVAALADALARAGPSQNGQN